MDFRQAVISGIRHYVTFSGRASRSEFWYWYLFIVFLGICLKLAETETHPDINIAVQILFLTVLVIILLPTLTLNVRRFHDLNISGWWLLLFILPGLLPMLHFVHYIPLALGCIKGTSGTNRFGKDPLDTDITSLAATIGVSPDFYEGGNP